MPEVTVCASSYRAAAYCEAWFRSLQSVPGMEIHRWIVTDSLSDDGTADRLRALGVEVLSQKCTVGTGRNLAISEAVSDWVLVVDSDNAYNLTRIPFPLREDRILVLIDADNMSLWLAAGLRRQFLNHPFVDQGGGGSGGGAEFAFFLVRAPVDVRVVRGLASDLKRQHRHRSVLNFYNRWFQFGLTTQDVLTMIWRLARNRKGWRLAAVHLIQLGVHFGTFGWAGRSPKFRD